MINSAWINGLIEKELDVIEHEVLTHINRKTYLDNTIEFESWCKLLTIKLNQFGMDHIRQTSRVLIHLADACNFESESCCSSILLFPDDSALIQAPRLVQDQQTRLKLLKVLSAYYLKHVMLDENNVFWNTVNIQEYTTVINRVVDHFKTLNELFIVSEVEAYVESLLRVCARLELNADNAAQIAYVVTLKNTKFGVNKSQLSDNYIKQVIELAASKFKIPNIDVWLEAIEYIKPQEHFETWRVVGMPNLTEHKLPLNI